MEMDEHVIKKSTRHDEMERKKQGESLLRRILLSSGISEVLLDLLCGADIVLLIEVYPDIAKHIISNLQILESDLLSLSKLLDLEDIFSFTKLKELIISSCVKKGYYPLFFDKYHFPVLKDVTVWADKSPLPSIEILKEISNFYISANKLSEFHTFILPETLKEFVGILDYSIAQVLVQMITNAKEIDVELNGKLKDDKFHLHFKQPSLKRLRCCGNDKQSNFNLTIQSIAEMKSLQLSRANLFIIEESDSSEIRSLILFKVPLVSWLKDTKFPFLNVLALSSLKFEKEDLKIANRLYEECIWKNQNNITSYDSDIEEIEVFGKVFLYINRVVDLFHIECKSQVNNSNRLFILDTTDLKTLCLECIDRFDMLTPNSEKLTKVHLPLEVYNFSALQTILKQSQCITTLGLKLYSRVWNLLPRHLFQTIEKMTLEIVQDEDNVPLIIQDLQKLTHLVVQHPKERVQIRIRNLPNLQNIDV